MYDMPISRAANPHTKEWRLGAYPFLMVQHPMGSCTLPELKARAEVAYRQGLPSLLETN